MLTSHRIIRLATAGAWDRLLDDVLANGRPLAASDRARLMAEFDVLPVIAMAMAVMRVAELAYRPDRNLMRLVDMLRRRVFEDHALVAASPTATDLVERALAEVARRHPQSTAA